MPVIASVQDLGEYRGTSYAIICLEYQLKCLKWLEIKYSDASCLTDTPTILIDSWAHTLAVEHFVFSAIAGLIVEMLFMLFSIYNAV